MSGEVGDVEVGRGFNWFLGLSKGPGNNTLQVGQLGCSQGGRRLRWCQIIQKLPDRGRSPGAESTDAGIHNQLHPSVALAASLQEAALQVRNGAGRRPEHCQGELKATWKPAAWSLNQRCCICACGVHDADSESRLGAKLWIV